MGCSFSSPELDGPVGADNFGHYGINGTGSGAYFGVSGTFAQAFGPGLPCNEVGNAVALLIAPTATYTCNTVNPTVGGSVLCPVAKTDMIDGRYTLSFSPLPTSVYYPGYIGDNFFEIDSGPPIATETAYQCVPEYPPATCTPDAVSSSLKTHKASRFCQGYLGDNGQADQVCVPILNQFPFTSLICGVLGTLDNPTPLYSYTRVEAYSPFDNCRDSCLASMSCTTFSFDHLSKECYLYGKSAYSMGFVADSASHLIFYNRNCFIASCEERLPGYVSSFSPSQISSACYCLDPTAAPVAIPKRNAVARPLAPKPTPPPIIKKSPVDPIFGRAADGGSSGDTFPADDSSSEGNSFSGDESSSDGSSSPGGGSSPGQGPSPGAGLTPGAQPTPGSPITVYSGPDVTWTASFTTTTVYYTNYICGLSPS